MSDEASPIPADWRLNPLCQLATFETGRTPLRANPRYWAAPSAEGTSWVSIGDMRPYGLITETAERITPSALRDVFRGRVSKKGTLIMSFKLTIGRVATLGIDACHNEAIISILPAKRMNQKYLEYFLSQVDYADYQDRAVKGNTLNQEKINRIAVIEPPKPEQEKIAATLWKVQRAIEVEGRLVAAARALKQSAMHHLFTSGLLGQPRKETEIGMIPQSWELLPLEKTCTFLSGGTPSKAQPKFWTGTIPWVSPKDLKHPRLRDVRDHISQAGLDAGGGLAPANSILVVIRGMILIRDVPVALIEVPMAFNQDLKAIVPGERLAPDFLLYACEAYKRTLFQKIGRSAHGTRTLFSSELARFLIPVPPPDEQQEIANILYALDRKISLHERKRAALSDLFQTMLHQLMTAQIRVDKLDIDTSEILDPHPPARSLEPKPSPNN